MDGSIKKIMIDDDKIMKFKIDNNFLLNHKQAAIDYYVELCRSIGEHEEKQKELLKKQEKVVCFEGSVQNKQNLVSVNLKNDNSIIKANLNIDLKKKKVLSFNLEQDIKHTR